MLLFVWLLFLVIRMDFRFWVVRNWKKNLRMKRKVLKKNFWYLYILRLMSFSMYDLYVGVSIFDSCVMMDDGKLGWLNDLKFMLWDLKGLEFVRSFKGVWRGWNVIGEKWVELKYF